MKASDAAQARGRRDRAGRRVRGVARAVILYGLLAAGSLVFALPFIWMVGSSFKVDREMFGERVTLMPDLPRPARVSPYLVADDARLRQADQFLRLRAGIASLVAGCDLRLPDYLAGRAAAPDALAPEVYRRMQQALPRAAWALPPPGVLAAISNRLDAELLAEVTRAQLRRCALGPIRVRSLDVEEKTVTGDQPLAQFWDVAGATLHDRPDGWADLAYDVRAAGLQEITLRATLDLPFPAARLFRIQVAFQPDDSWHDLAVYIEKNGRKYQALREEHTGLADARVITLQEYGPLDAPDSNRMRTWLPYREVAAGAQYESRPDKARLTLVLRENSRPGAWWAKCARNYARVFQFVPFWRYAATSAFLAILNILGAVFSCSIVAYAFARLQWPGRGLGFAVMLATMMIPPQVTMIPYFLIMKHLGWYNTLSPLWITSFTANAFNVFLLRQFMKGIPRDMEDSAKIDGCNFLQVYWHIILPLIKPTLACIAIFTFMGVWNDFMGPLVFLADQRLYPLSLGLYALNVQQGGDFGLMMAGSLLMTLPVIALFFFAQKYFIQGITLTGMKG